MHKIITSIFLLLPLISLGVKYESLEDIVKSSRASAEFTSLGGYRGETIEASIKNRSTDTIFFAVEPGRIFLSPDSSYQDLLVVFALQDYLAPGKSGKYKLKAFCCRASKGSPAAGLAFKMGPMSPESWIGLAQLINRSAYPQDAIQHAVWVMSDNHAVSSVTSTPLSETHDLRRYLSEQKGVEFPWYGITYKSDTTRLFSGEHERLSGEIKFYLRNQVIVTAVIRDEIGRVVTVLTKSSAGYPGDHILPVNISVAGWPKGTYEVQIFEDGNNLNTRQKFTL